ncbi:TIGR00341 family protein [Haladaptatus litoreus]|uniref:TIGR00341 family protein n=1 Tax=Haladaptatus litoreus TaxID=553468 RepID=A0A1N7E180_9EURY|nr:TIGR00341 family protein [Haladaptatus litoreus]SIR81705.1 TIGR00341 family protein [Haladaptatus litoreus]
MRLIQVLVPDDCRDAVLAVLNDERIDYVLTREESNGDNSAIVQFPLPAQAVDRVLSDLREAGLSDDYTVIGSVETARTPNIEELEDKFVKGGDEDDSIATDEIRTKALGMNPSPVTYYAMTVLSAIVATAGLLLDSPAIVVGSMVIAPQVGSAMTASVGLVLNDRHMIIDGLRSQILGLGVAIVSATIFGWALKSAQFIPPSLNVVTVNQISQRISPGFLSVAVGLCAGAAGALGLATALPVSLVGVMIAAALIPAAAAVGIGLAWGPPVIALGAFVLLVVNAVSINAAGGGVLWLLGYRPVEGTTIRKAAPTLIAVAVLLVAFAGSGLVMSKQMQTENAVNEEVQSVLEQERYQQLELVKIQVEFDDMGTLDDSQQITVVVRRPTNEPYPQLSERLASKISGRLDGKTIVEVEFTESQRSTVKT